MSKYQELDAARKILELAITADTASIKSNYRRLLAEYHPDRKIHPQELCHQKTQELIEAYQIISDYCQNYRFSFSEETIKRHLSAEQWWAERFGPDPLWGKHGRK